MRRGKVRDSFDLGDRLVLVTTDRQSAFDRILAEVPFKGQVLNQLAAFWFEQTRELAANHMLDVPDPNVMVVAECEQLPLEFVVRGYITGVTTTSLWFNSRAAAGLPLTWAPERGPTWK
jgi:phosphoribosylaminoimidazole-succinocarboxamide synthase